MMNRQFLKTTTVLAMSALLVACTTDIEEGRQQSGAIAEIGISFTVPQEQSLLLGETPSTYSITNPGTDTDEGTTAGYVPRDVWVIQYDGTEDASRLVGLPRYVNLEQGSAVQAVTSTAINTLVFVANTHDANIEWGNINTLGNVKKACKTIAQETDCYGNNFSISKDLIMSGKYEGVITSGSISAQLYRNIARIDFTLVNAAGSGMTLKSVQLCNVPKNFYYAAGLIAAGTKYPEGSDYFNYPEEDLAGVAGPGESQTLTWYMPLNQKGINTISTTSKTKPGNAPSYATWIRVLATDVNNEAYVYKIYPGENMINDYNISTNHRYNISITINSSGDASTDGRIEHYGKVEFASANSYILNPAPAGTADRVYTIPIGRLNEFWKNVDNTLTIGEGDSWKAELLWQDTPSTDFIRFVDLETGELSTTMTGTGVNQRIAVTTRAGYEGNALIGIKKDGKEAAGYIWSWHLWVTDYDPAYNAAPVDGQYIYAVKAGAVHRYSGDTWTSSSVGRYKTKYIMDRNLGARTDGYSTVGALYYQFGRKDPFPCIGYSNVLYDINGNSLNYNGNNENANTGVTLATGVLKPTTFYYKEATVNYGDWTNEGKTGDYIWNHTQEGTELKSIFDPCPPGWKIPAIEVWQDFVYDVSSPANSTCMNINRDPQLGWTYNGYNGIRYWPKNSNVTGSIYYPAIGNRRVGAGTMSYVSNQAFYWNSSPYSSALGKNMTSSNQAILSNTPDHRGHAFSVRCIQE